MISTILQDLEAIFSWILAASWQASVLAVLVLLLQRTLGARLNPRWRYALWLLVLVRLVLPALPESAWSLFQFAPPPPASFVVPVTEPLFVTTSLPASSTDLTPVEANYPFSFYSLLAVIWLAGATALLLLTWQVNRRFARQIANSPGISDPELLNLFATAKAELGIRHQIRLIESSQVQSPAIMGLFQSTLLLPSNARDKFDRRELRFIFLHELAHLKRGDVIAQALIALLQIVHWFNPILWFAFRRMRIDREPATDALVLSRTGEDEKERYGLMLIKLLEHFNQRHSLPTLVGILEDKDQFKRRFSLIAHFTRGAYGWSLLGIFTIGALAVVCLTKAKATEPPAASAAVSVTNQPAASNSNAPMVWLKTMVIQVGESDYQAHQGVIDAAIQKGDVAALLDLHLKSLHPTSNPSVLTRSGEQAVVEIVKVLRFASTFGKDSSGKRIDAGFKTVNLGTRVVFKPIVTGDKIDVRGHIDLASLADWILTKDLPPQPDIHNRNISMAVLLKSGHSLGIELPGGAKMEFRDPTLIFTADKIPTASENPKILARDFLLLSAQLYTGDGKPVTSTTPVSENSGVPLKTDTEQKSSSDLAAHQQDLLAAKEDADARHLLVEKTAKLTNAEFVNTMDALGRSNPTVTALRTEIDNKNDEIATLLRTGFADNHPRVQTLKAELTTLQEQMKDVVDGMRRALALDAQIGDSRVALLTKNLNDTASPPTGTLTPQVSTTTSPASIELALRQKDLLGAQEDADARRVLLDNVKDLPDDKFINTLHGLGHEDSVLTALQIDIGNRKADIANLLKEGFIEDHPRILSLRAGLAVKEQRMKDLLDSTRKAMTIDSQMADSRVSLLQREVDHLKAQITASSEIHRQKS